MMRWTVVALMLMAVLAGCQLDTGQQAPAPLPSASASEVTPHTPAASEPAPSEAPPSAPDGTSLTGVLGGDAQLEGGCVWLETDEGRVEPLWPTGYTATTDPGRLLDPPGEQVAEEGDRITITGGPAQDVATICQVGEVWNVTEVTVAAGG
ncbi:MAG TPA: hypothetical protein VK891_12620 [Euzebyales bacterium]|nr:hypothetical protein [Euzebyales bacterium]